MSARKATADISPPIETGRGIARPKGISPAGSQSTTRFPNLQYFCGTRAMSLSKKSALFVGRPEMVVVQEGRKRKRPEQMLPVSFDFPTSLTQTVSLEPSVWHVDSSVQDHSSPVNVAASRSIPDDRGKHVSALRVTRLCKEKVEPQVVGLSGAFPEVLDFFLEAHVL